jgi:hypothetical protein
MSVLLGDDLRNLDEAIDNEIEKFGLLSFTRDKALISLFGVFEEYINSLYSEQSKFKNLAGTQRKFYMSLDYCVQWVYRFTTSHTGGRTITEADLVVALEMLMAGTGYSDVATQMSLAFRGSTKIRRIDGTHFEASPGSLTEQEQDVGRMIIEHANDPKTPEAINILSAEDVSSL